MTRQPLSSKISGQTQLLSEFDDQPIATTDRSSDREFYTLEDSRAVHRLAIGELEVEASVPMIDDVEGNDAKGAWWKAYLRGHLPEPVQRTGRTVRAVDLFCGSGGLALGLRQLCRELGMSVVTQLAADVDEEATAVYSANHESRFRVTRSVWTLLDFAVRTTADGSEFPYRPELTDEVLASHLTGIDVVLAGPPCQGHSNLNNHTRRDDPRNHLYLTVPAFAVAVGAPICVIENVPAILNDSHRVVSIARQLFEASGYRVTEGMLSASSMGWPQTRKRHFMVARRDAPPEPLERVATILAEDRVRSAWWAIGDLEDFESADAVDQHTELSSENVDRISWLFDNGAHDLALPERPESHRQGTSYQAVYGRMHRDLPAQTITTGFMSPGRGRYVHPTRRRVITAHEAARLQGFPDTYVFTPDPNRVPSRAKLAKWIGDAVPLPLGYGAALSALAAGFPQD